MRHGDIFFRALAERNQFLGRQLANDLCGRSDHERARRDFRALGYESLGPDEAFLSDLGPVEHRGSHAHQTEVANPAGMNNRRVADRAVGADHRWHIVGQMNDGSVLHIGPLPDLDRFDVSAKHSSIENTRVSAQPHIPDQSRIRGNKGRERGIGLPSEKFIKALVDRH